MKKIAMLGLMLGLLGLSTATSWAATYTLLKADIPFEFVIANKTMPAGKYTVEPGSASHTLVVRSADWGATCAVSANGKASSGRTGSYLLFRKYGDRYFLAEVWNEAKQRGSEIRKSKTERELLARGFEPIPVTILAQR